jgi:hypothetical protein
MGRVQTNTVGLLVYEFYLLYPPYLGVIALFGTYEYIKLRVFNLERIFLRELRYLRNVKLFQKLFEPILSLWIPSSFSQFGHGSSGWTTEQYIHILFLWTTWITAIFKPHFWLHSRNNLVRRGKKGKWRHPY